MTPSTPTAPSAPAAGSLTRSQRLDRLPFTRRHGRLLGASGIGWALDAMDVGLISFVIAALSVHWELSKADGSLIASAGFAGMAIGASVGGLLADRLGRRFVFALTLLVYGLATGASALAMGVGALIVLRFVVGLGLGAELPVASTLMSEFAPARIRGRVIVWLEAFWALGWILAAVIGTFVAASGPTGWRWALAVGLVPAVYSLVIRLGMPESVRFLEKQGRHEEAERVVRGFEDAAGVASPTHASAPADGTEDDSGRVAADEVGAIPAADQVAASGGIWSRPLRARTAGLWAVWFCINLSYYGAFIWIPTLLVDRGFDLTRSFTFTLIITLAQIPGYAVAAWLIEVLGRRWTLTVFLAGSALAATAYGLADSEATIIAAGCALSFFNLGAWGALYAIGPELYPTRVRGTGTGAAAAFGRIASMLAPFLVPVLLVAGGQWLVFTVFGLAFALAAAAAFTLPEQRGKALAE
ncbi:MFS transporter [Brachybacterium saurashtrense]|uniref:MFS transporter n=1 Tax=Brachybacterium saurashtrense TaxID=556288 RepID=A0A345YR15_9MICO|nr:MFS transporter [Brachybacterium saurashtrense]AXK46367.1 MFS transporter [Brachybacterium saurashtrense]RRR24107.1 MFS transporter [Brachybacterium saurashtrense]